MNTLHEARHISVPIQCEPNKVYAFASDPKNLPAWATGLAGSIKQVGDAWIAEAPMGKVTVRFAEKNPFGVLDHDIILESGTLVHNPMRVLPNGNGSEVLFTLFRQADVSDEKFEQDARWVQRDLRALKEILER